eukprot:TRINITY_DN94759_c0_g1_i1.p1 TRINITY_DN94759_c0_g1~~TRINITY_DN94759_c0_g1_i1.p1  ORF type:complete len:235 (+),score=51.17 TRINITY_DN94759_c0_g1_i1:77-706(+)
MLSLGERLRFAWLAFTLHTVTAVLMDTIFSLQRLVDNDEEQLLGVLAASSRIVLHVFIAYQAWEKASAQVKTANCFNIAVLQRASALKFHRWRMRPERTGSEETRSHIENIAPQTGWFGCAEPGPAKRAEVAKHESEWASHLDCQAFADYAEKCSGGLWHFGVVRIGSGFSNGLVQLLVFSQLSKLSFLFSDLGIAPKDLVLNLGWFSR